MSTILTNLRNTIIAGFILAFILVFALAQGSFDQTAFNMWLLRWFHVLSAIMWIGILYYFNFIQIPNMGNIPMILPLSITISDLNFGAPVPSIISPFFI